ncbi:unnamed protein product [Closterium sp. Naga37s-1]|nr:unnamed protein product [Closterium sp. Naga37s-1]
MASRKVVRRMAAVVAVWMGLAGVLAGLVAWRVQKGFEDNRKAELDTWCAGRARSLQQQFMLTADHVQVLAGLATVFGGVRTNPWAVGSCLTQRHFVHLVERTVAAQPWVHAVGYMAVINGSDRAAFERKAQCKLLDILGKPAPEADWYMNSRVWFQENPPMPLLKMTSTCVNVRTHPSYGPGLSRMYQLPTNQLNMPYVLDNGEAGMGMGFPIFRDGVTTSSPLEERRAALVGLIAASIDFKSLAAFIISEVLRQGVEYSLEVYDVTPTDFLPNSSTPLGPRLLYGVGDLPEGDPMQVAKLIPPSNQTMLQPHRHKSVQQINLTDTSRSYQLWCRGADTVVSWTTVLLAVVIVVVAALLAGIGVSVACNTRSVHEKVTALAVLKERTQAAERNKSAFIANTAHELRTPIIGLKGMLEELAEGEVDGRQREDVGTAVGEVERIVALINVVLDVSKAEAGRLHMETLPFHTRSWLKEALHSHACAAHARNLTFTCRVDTSVPEVLEGDYMRLQQVVDSIVDNAIKFTASGAVCVRLQRLPPDTHIPTHLLSLGCLVAESTPGCSSPAAAADAASVEQAAGPMSRREQVEQRGLLWAVMGNWDPPLRHQLSSLSARFSMSPWRTPLGEGGRRGEGEGDGEREGKGDGEEGAEGNGEGEGQGEEGCNSTEHKRREGEGAAEQGRGEGGGAAVRAVGGRDTAGGSRGVQQGREESGGREKEGEGGAGWRGGEGASLMHDKGEGTKGLIRAGPCAGASAGDAREGGAREGETSGRGDCGVGGTCEAGSAAAAAAAGGGDSTGIWRDAVRRWWQGPVEEESPVPLGDAERRCVVLLTCEDTGCGIAEEEQRDVFQAFMQAHQKRHAHGGSGMSLHLSRQLVSLLGGSMGLISTEGFGTTLHVAVPLAATASPPPPATSPASSPAAHPTTYSAPSAAASGADGGAERSPVARVGNRSWSASEGLGCGKAEGSSVVERTGEKLVSAKDALKEMLHGMAILVVDDNVINRPSFLIPLQPPCMPLPACPPLHAPPCMPLPACPSLTQVVDDNLINRPSVLINPVVDDNLINHSQPSAPLYTPCAGQVVDDNLINRRVAASTLARYGAEVALAESGEAALRLLQARHSFRLVLMDLHMPGLDGFQTTARLRAFEAATQMAREEQGEQGLQRMPVVVESGAEGGDGEVGWQPQQRVHVVAMSADVDSTVAALATEAGMDGAVQKPLNERVLLQTGICTTSYYASLSE